MPQLYVLSILANIMGGLTLAGDYVGTRFAFLSSFKDIRSNRGRSVTIGILAAVVGVLKLVVRSPGETVPVVGDLLPALGGIAVGLMLLAEQLRPGSSATDAGQKLDRVASSALTYRVPAGIAGAVIAIVHFLFPAAVIL